MELNREKTIEALECLQDEDRIFCNQKCYYYDYLCKTYHCERAVGRDALALIKSQEQRIGELEKRLCYLLQSKTIAEYDEVDINTKEYVKDIHSLDANIEHLTKELTRKETEYNELYELLQTCKADSEAYRSYSKTLEKENEGLKNLLDESFEAQNTVKADTVRKMQHTIWLEFSDCTEEETVIIGSLRNTVDQIAKEMLEGENERPNIH